jgi:chromate transporter
MDDMLLRLLGHFFVQSLMAIGGINVIIAELQRVLVVETGWLAAKEFAALFALAQAAPGPNTIFIALIGWRLGGIGWALLSTLVFLVPSFVVSVLLARGWERWSAQRWFELLRRGLVPVTVGLLASSSALLAQTAAVSPVAVGVTAAAAALTLTTRLPPVAILAMAAVLGALGLV